MTLNTSKLSCACGATLESAFTTEINNWQELHKDCEKSDVSIPYDQFCMVMLKAGIELAQKVDRLVTVLEAKQQPYADKAAVSNDRINVDPATGDMSVGTAKQEQKRPQNCGTSYCSCIECVMDEQKQDEPVAITTGMALAFHRALSDGPISKDEAEEIKRGLEAAFAHITTPSKQEQGEPVGEAYLCDQCSTPFDGAYECPSCGHNTSTKEPVYTTPQQRKPLTYEQFKATADEVFGFVVVLGGYEDAVRTLYEAAHGIKGEA